MSIASIPPLSPEPRVGFDLTLTCLIGPVQAYCPPANNSGRVVGRSRRSASRGSRYGPS
jgi:hypothetical protein